MRKKPKNKEHYNILVVVDDLREHSFRNVDLYGAVSPYSRFMIKDEKGKEYIFEKDKVGIWTENFQEVELKTVSE